MSYTTAQRHAIIQKKIINLDRFDPGPILCFWDVCEKPATSVYTYVECRHDPRVPCERADRRSLAAAGQPAHGRFGFCCNRHLAYWQACTGPAAADTGERHRGNIYGNLPPGYRLSI